MHKFDLMLLSIKKEIRELCKNKVRLFILGITGIILFFLPLLDQFFFKGVIYSKNNQFLIFLVISMICIFFVSQYMFDSCKLDFTTGGTVFFINNKISAVVYVLGKEVVCILMLFFLYCCRLSDIKNILTMKSYIWLFLFYFFEMNNTFFFTMLFYREKFNLIAYGLTYIVPVIIFLILSLIKVYFIKYLLIIISIIIQQTNLTKIYESKSFRVYLS